MKYLCHLENGFGKGTTLSVSRGKERIERVPLRWLQRFVRFFALSDYHVESSIDSSILCIVCNLSRLTSYSMN